MSVTSIWFELLLALGREWGFKTTIYATINTMRWDISPGYIVVSIYVGQEYFRTLIVSDDSWLHRAPCPICDMPMFPAPTSLFNDTFDVLVDLLEDFGTNLGCTVWHIGTLRSPQVWWNNDATQTCLRLEDDSIVVTLYLLHKTDLSRTIRIIVVDYADPELFNKLTAFHRSIVKVGDRYEFEPPAKDS